jgi:hypothetical protein
MYHTIFLLRQLTWLAVISLLTSNAIANKVGFEINQKAVKSSDLETNSKLFKLAKEVA